MGHGMQEVEPQVLKHPGIQENLGRRIHKLLQKLLKFICQELGQL